MTTRPMKTLTLPINGQNVTYTFEPQDGSITTEKIEDGAITSAKLNDSVKTGVFEDMTVGTSLAVMNDEGVTDNLAYKFRQTGGDAVRELDEIHGGTIAWNQLVTGGASSSVNGVTSTNNGDGTFTISGTATATAKISVASTSIGLHKNVGHKYLFWGCPSGSPSTYYMTILFIGETAQDTGNGAIYSLIDTPYTGQLGVIVKSGVTVNITVRPQFFDLTQMFGSTVADAIYAMEQSSQGSGVAYFRSLFPNAYYAYNSGELVSVEGLSAHVTNSANLFDEATAVKYNMFITNTNKWAVSDGSSMCVCYYCKPNITYTVSYGDPSVTNFRTGVINVDPATAPANAPLTQVNRTLSAHTFTTDSDAVAIIIQIDRGTYEAGTSKLQVQIGDTATAFKKYAQHTYPLDSTLTLRGVPKWSNGLYFDGDIYRHDGSVTRNTVQIDLSSLTWQSRKTGETHKLWSSTLPYSYEGTNTTFGRLGWISDKYVEQYPSSAAALTPIVDTAEIGLYSYKSYAATDDTIYAITEVNDTVSGSLVYAIATPTAETADPYQQYQICDGKGTEEYVSETVTPVGHNTFYPVDIVSKVNKLPSDFSTLIAQTETGFKATRNYTAKQFLIINNQLYRVTANIANGANIVPNTNVTAVTIADILTTLI